MVNKDFQYYSVRKGHPECWIYSGKPLGGRRSASRGLAAPSPLEPSPALGLQPLFSALRSWPPIKKSWALPCSVFSNRRTNSRQITASIGSVIRGHVM